MVLKRQSVTSSLLFLAIAEIFFNFSGYIIHSALGRMLGPADYGRFGLIVNLTTTVVMLIGNGIPTAMSKYISGIFETAPGLVMVIKRQAAILQTLLMGVVTFVFWLLAPAFSSLLHDPTLTPLFRISAFILPSFAAASFYLYYYIGIHKFNLQAALKIVRSFARIIFVIGLAYLFGVKGSVAAYIIAPASVFVTAWLIDKFWIDRNFPKEFSRRFDWQKLLSYAWPVTLFMLFFQILTSLDLYMVKALLRDDRLTGIYNAALTLGYIPYYLFSALTLVILPSISRTTVQNNHAETTRVIVQSFRMMVLILIPLAVIMFVYPVPIIQFFFGNRYIDAAFPFQILSSGISFLALFYVMCFALNGAGMIKIPMYTALGGMILNGILNYFFVLRYGINGSAIATALTSILITIIILFYIRKHFDGLMKPVKFMKFIAAGVVMYLASFFFPPQKWIFFLWGIILCGVYVLVLYAIGEFTKVDLQTFKKILLPRKK
jgi:stage V sporulation protein B